MLVTGATGQQGGATARRLLEHGHKVRAVTRDPASAKAKGLAALGATLVTADLLDLEAMTRAADGADALFAISTPFEAGVDAEIQQAVTAAKAARAAGTAHFVYTSVAGADRKSGIEHFDSKGRAEAMIRELGLPHTFLGPAPFLDNLFAPWNLPFLRDGKFAMPLPRHFPMQQVAVVDIAAFAVLVLENKDRFLGRRIDIASDEVSGQRMFEVLNQRLTRPLEYKEMTFEQISPELGRLFSGAGKPGTSPMPRIDLEGLRRDYPEVGWHTFETWAATLDLSFLK